MAQYNRLPRNQTWYYVEFASRGGRQHKALVRAGNADGAIAKLRGSVRTTCVRRLTKLHRRMLSDVLAAIDEQIVVDAAYARR